MLYREKGFFPAFCTSVRAVWFCPSLMPFVSDMALYHHACHPTVCAVWILPCPMPLVAHTVLFWLFDTIRYGFDYHFNVGSVSWCPDLHSLLGKIIHHRSVVLDDARVDQDFWPCLHHHTFFDVHVFNCFGASNHSTTLAAILHKHEVEKRCTYEERLHKMEHGSFTSLVFFASGGMGNAATTTYKHLACLLSKK